jgi:hypothetical protein
MTTNESETEMLDIDNDRDDVAYDIYSRSTATEIEHRDFDPHCYIISKGTFRVAIGDDPVDPDGITWRSYWALEDSAGAYEEDDACGGWAYGDSETALREVGELINAIDARS